MLTLRAFMNIAALYSTVPGTISELGEFSTLSRTYSNNKTEYNGSAIKGYTLVSLSCIDSTTNNETAVPQAVTDLCISIVDQMMAYSANNALPFVLSTYLDAMVVDSGKTISNPSAGNFVTNPGGITLPEYISFTHVPTGDVITVWLSDSAFQVQYDLFNIVIVPPLPNIDDFFKPPLTVEQELAAVSSTSFFQSIQGARGSNPETFLESYEFDYIPPVAGYPHSPTNWAALIYGIQGNNLDTIKDAIGAYIAANSAQPLSAWEALFPDIYARTEFLMIPRWDQMSIPNMQTVPGYYSVMTAPTDDLAFITAKATFYPAGYVGANVKIMTHYYKYLSIVTVPGNKNIPSITDLKALFPDYIPESSNSLDFNRMSLATQQWSTLIEQMLIVAETMTAFSPVPATMRRIYRNNVMFLSAVFNNVDYVMAVKSTY